MVVNLFYCTWCISAVSPRTIPNTRAMEDNEESSVQLDSLAFIMACIGNNVFVTSIHDATNCVGNGIIPLPDIFASLGRILL